ncbi:hypothetical protein KNV19_gp60 [Gordonia phage Portcullis]|uniref:Phage Gp37/Gp68 family protein n=1 Tax=Gordonia phage Portcullis TaxID=2762414 RepID=A0A7G8LGK2_9CAUD|nr:hypothetical protein KNV19_gp60 [Gordonia phage Portcullis]QNJ56374.1 hypothetical protein SEA_PORTCULLIS_60 [Gordonia phage Portcullis]
MSTKIEWTDETWNPVTGCTKVSAGCDHCYAETFAERFRGTPGHYFENGFDVQIREHKLREPLRWRKPRKVFVNSMSDLFHDKVPDEYIAQVFAVMALAPQHTFQVLTKRHARMRSLLSDWDFQENVKERYADNRIGEWTFDWPLPNVHLLVSVENQQWAEIRIPALLDTPAAVRGISVEPMLGPVRLCCYITAGPDVEGPSEFCWMHGRSSLDWVIVGGESGPGARPMHPDWARSLRDQCVAAGVPFLFKQWGEWAPQPPAEWRRGDMAVDIDGGAYALGDAGLEELPVDLRRRSYLMRRVGKKTAGRELDGRTWDQYPDGDHR